MSNRDPLNRIRQERVLEDTAAGSYMMQCQQSSFSYLAPMLTHDVAELTWENGQLALHELNGMLPLSTSSPRPLTWERTEDTLESIVRQATENNRKLASTTNLSGNKSDHIHTHHKDVKNECSVAASTEGAAGKYWGKTGSSNGKAEFSLQHSSMMSMSMPMNKRARMDHSDDQTNNQRGRRNSLSFSEEEYWADQGGACACAGAAFCGENSNNRNNNDTSTTMMTWASLESPRSTMRTKTTDEDSVCDHGGSENQEEGGTKGETATGRSSSARRGRAAAIHNQSERRRRDRINQKMKALQKLVPNANKTDKASMLDEVIEYLKQLQAQVQMMASARTMSHLIMPLEMQHQLQMSILARMGMGAGLGMGMGILDFDKVNAPATTNTTTMPPQQLAPLLHPSFQLATNASSTFPPSSFVAPSMIPPSQLNNEDVKNSNASSLHNPYNAFLAQSMKMEMYNRMSGLYRQQMHQSIGVPLQSKSLQHSWKCRDDS